MTVYAPGTLEKDPTKQNMALQQHAGLIDTANANIAANAASITALQAAQTRGVFSVDRNGTDQTGLTASAYNKVSFNNKIVDVDGWFDAITNFRYTPLIAGTYQICLSIGSATGTSSEGPQAAIYKNGSLAKVSNYLSTTSSGFFTTEVVAYFPMNGTTDYIEGFVYLPASVTTLGGFTRTTFMSGHRLSS